MNPFRRNLASMLLAVGLALPAAAEAADGTVFLDTVGVTFSATGETGLDDAAGNLSVFQGEFEAGGRTVLSPKSVLLHGLGFTRTELRRDASSLLPERLEEISVRLGWQHDSGVRWRYSVLVRPGFFGDGGTLTSDTFNVPFLGLASYAASRELVWSFGAVANAFSDNPVLPVAGVRWEFAPAWTLNLGFPRAGLGWAIRPGTTLTAGATFQGGAYRLTRSPVADVAAGSRFAGEELDYREIRVGVGGSFQLSPTMRLSVDVGMVVDQRFDYHEIGLERRGDNALAGALSLRTQF